MGPKLHSLNAPLNLSPIVCRKDYTVFEQGVNTIIAEKMTSERSRDYMNARRVTKEYEACTRGLNKAAACVPPTGSQEETKQVEQLMIEQREEEVFSDLFEGKKREWRRDNILDDTRCVSLLVYSGPVCAM